MRYGIINEAVWESVDEWKLLYVMFMDPRWGRNFLEKKGKQKQVLKINWQSTSRSRPSRCLAISRETWSKLTEISFELWQIFEAFFFLSLESSVDFEPTPKTILALLIRIIAFFNLAEKIFHISLWILR